MKKKKTPTPQPTKKSGRDLVLVRGVDEEQSALNVVRFRDERVELGTVRKLEEGKPLMGEVVKLTPHADFPLLCDVEVQYPSPIAETNDTIAAGHGPAQVATDRYRKNWDAIWKRPQRKRELTN